MTVTHRAEYQFLDTANKTFPSIVVQFRYGSFVFLSSLTQQQRNISEVQQRHVVEKMSVSMMEDGSAWMSWMGAILGTSLVGISGLVPMLIIPLDAGPNLRSEQGSRKLRLLLSFAVGGLLGDVFLHLIPESYGALKGSGSNTHTGYLVMGLWILGEYFMHE